MTWYKVDDGIHSHPKFLDVSLAAVGLWTMCGAWCSAYLTDGQITRRQVQRLGGDDTLAAELVDAGLWRETGDGYVFHDWGDYQPTREDVEASRAAARERMRKRRNPDTGKFAPRSEDVRANTERTEPERAENFGVGSSTPTRPDPTRPDPTPTARSARKAPAKRLPEDWAPTDAHRKKAAELGVDLELEADRFRLHAEANDRRAVRWDAAFSMWLTKATPPLPGMGARGNANDRRAQDTAALLNRAPWEGATLTTDDWRAERERTAHGHPNHPTLDTQGALEA